MKSTFIICFVLIATCFLVGCKTAGSRVAVSGGSGPAVDGLQMSLAILSSAEHQNPEFEVSIRNIGESDVSVNLGLMLANGKVMLPVKIYLRMADEMGNQRRLFLPSVNIAGRADDYVVPLRAGSAYSVRLRLDQFISSEAKEYQVKRPPGKCEFTAEFEGTPAEWVNRDTLGMKLMKYWLGNLQSNTVVLQQ